MYVSTQNSDICFLFVKVWFFEKLESPLKKGKQNKKENSVWLIIWRRHVSKNWVSIQGLGYLSGRYDVTTRSQPCRYCPLWTQRDPHDFKMRFQLREVHTFIALRTFPLIQCRMSQTPPSPMKTQHPRCIPWDFGVKQTNTPYGGKQTLTPKLEINSDTICNDLLSTL